MKTLLKVVTLLTIATVIFAQNLPTRGPVSFDTYDLNNDNQITQSEFDTIKNQRMTQNYNQGKMMRKAGNSPTFQNIDTNGDGAITKNELTTHQEQRFNQRTNQGQGFMQKEQGRGNGMRQGGQVWQ